jgi:hypothetical protein
MGLEGRIGIDISAKGAQGRHLAQCPAFCPRARGVGNEVCGRLSPKSGGGQRPSLRDTTNGRGGRPTDSSIISNPQRAAPKVEVFLMISKA